MKANTFVALAALAVGGPAVAHAQQAQGNQPPPCSTPEHRHFDFWIGDWDVSANGRVVGRNRIERVLGGCALQENWEGGQSRGHSYNIYDAARRRWHQTWVDNSGLLLQIEGGLNESGAMVLEGERPGRNGGTVRDRITWSPNADGSVRQHWEASQDGGQTWRTLFDGTYRRRS